MKRERIGSSVAGVTICSWVGRGRIGWTAVAAMIGSKPETSMARAKADTHRSPMTGYSGDRVVTLWPSLTSTVAMVCVWISRGVWPSMLAAISSSELRTSRAVAGVTSIR